MDRKLILTTVVLLGLDMVYLKLTGGHFNTLVKSIQGNKLTLQIVPAVLAYITLVFSLYYFIIRENRKITDAMLLGWSIYLVYDFTNKAIFDKWTWETVLLDGVWGGILYGLTTYIVYKLK
jgi:uncharacterized membrane protein